jgi:hypothetical protein
LAKQRGYPSWRNIQFEIEKAIKNSRYFIRLVSSKSVNRRGTSERELKYALDKQLEFSESDVYPIPVRLDDCPISDSKLEEIQYVDLFPEWNTGFTKLLQSVSIDKINEQPTNNIEKIKNNIESSLISMELSLAPSRLGSQLVGESTISQKTDDKWTETAWDNLLYDIKKSLYWIWCFGKMDSA